MDMNIMNRKVMERTIMSRKVIESNENNYGQKMFEFIKIHKNKLVGRVKSHSAKKGGSS